MLDRFKASADQEPRLYPYRFTLKRLGITEEVFESRIERGVEGALTEFATARCQALRQREEITVTHPLVPLTKADCLRHFRQNGMPPPGALMGVYCWAADLDIARYNFELGFDPESITLLDAYD